MPKDAEESGRTVWVLDTETKGTGAEMVPLETLEQRKRSRGTRPTRARRRTSRSEQGETARVKVSSPHRFRVVNVLTRQTVADDAGIREAVEVLRPLRSAADANVYVWEPAEETWRLLTFGEKKALWALRDR